MVYVVVPHRRRAPETATRLLNQLDLDVGPCMLALSAFLSGFVVPAVGPNLGPLLVSVIGEVFPKPSAVSFSPSALIFSSFGANGTPESLLLLTPLSHPGRV